MYSMKYYNIMRCIGRRPCSLLINEIYILIILSTRGEIQYKKIFLQKIKLKKKYVYVNII